MEITLKNGLTISEREIRFYHKFSEKAIKKQFRFAKRVMKHLDSYKAAQAMEMANMRKELELRKHPDYDQYHKEWLVQYKIITGIWDKENQEKEKGIDIQIANLKKEKIELRNTKY